MEIKIKYEKKYIAFLDVLGFSDLVFSKKVDHLEKYFQTVIDSFLQFSAGGLNIEKILISYSIILTVPNTVEDFKNLLRSIRAIHTFLIEEQIILRGAVSFGIQ